MKTLFAAALMLTAATPALAQESYRAIGTEPFWSATIDARTITLKRPGERDVTVAKPRPIVGFNGERYETPRLSLDITHVKCSDGMSDRTFRDTVRIVVRGQTLRGCGGDVIASTPAPGPGASVIDGDYTVALINGRPVARQTNPTVSFRMGRISGNASCNRFNGGYTFSKGRLTAGPLASTKMACGQRVQNVQEADILRILGEELTVSSNRNGSLVLSTRGRYSQTLTLVRNRR